MTISEFIGNSTAEEVCDMAGDVGTNWVLILIHSITLLLNFSGFVLIFNNTLFIAGLKIFHISMRMQCVNINVGLVVRSFLTCCRSAVFIVNAIKNRHPCHFQISGEMCDFETVIISGSMNIYVGAIVSYTIERTLATIYASTYQDRKFTVIGVGLLSIGYLLYLYTMLDFLSAYLKTRNDPSRVVPYCSSITSSAATSNMFVALLPFICLLIAAILLVITRAVTAKKLKLHLSTQSHSLATRYEQHQILAASVLMFPIIIFSALVIIIGFCSIIFLMFAGAAELVTLAQIKELFSLLMAPPLINLTPILFKWRYKKIEEERAARTTRQDSPTSSMNNLQAFWERH